MNRKVFLNDVDNVHMYAVESGTNSNNCADSCSNCSSGGSNDGGNNEFVEDLVVAGVVVTIENPQNLSAMVLVTAASPGPL